MSLQEKGIETTSWSTHDPACNHCRVRKIRCGREHPQCANCIRNGVQCDFSDHGKRINHMKLLVSNVSGLEARLTNIERELSRLTQTLRSISGQLPTSSISTNTSESAELLWGEPWSQAFQPIDASARIYQTYQLNRHVVPGQDTTERYHGPCTLLSMCEEFRYSVNEMQKINSENRQTQSEESSKRVDKCKALLVELCNSAGVEESLDLKHDNLQVFLPPKQFLLMACSTFFQLEDPAVDVFCQSTFWPNVDKIYCNPYSQTDQAWALCFNTIILLVLDAEQPENGGNISSDSVIGSQFAIPFISTIRLALASPEILLFPKLINVQALALLSVAAQQYLEPSLAGIFLAQACLLAKRMGLHQQMESEPADESTELDERTKVFRSLFLRDKTNLLSRGIHCWLPSFDCNLSFIKERADDKDMVSRFHLAHLQEDIYRFVYSSDSYRRPETSRKAALRNIERNFEQWTSLYGKPDDAESQGVIDVKLGFLASRIIALRSSSEVSHREQVVKDSRLSCQLLTASGDVSGISFRHNRSPSVEASSLPTFSRNNSSKELPSWAGAKSSSRLRSLAEGLCVPAFFGLINNVIWPVVGDDIPGDVRLLNTLNHQFQELDLKSQTNNSARKISRAFQGLLRIAELLRPELFPSHSQQHADVIPIMPSSFLNNAASMSNLSVAIPGSHSSAYSTTNTTRTNTPPFDLLQPLDYDASSGQFELTQQFSSSPDHIHKRQCLVVPTATSSDDFIDHNLFCYFPGMSSLMPMSNDKQNGASNTGFGPS